MFAQYLYIAGAQEMYVEGRGSLLLAYKMGMLRACEDEGGACGLGHSGSFFRKDNRSLS